MLRLFVALEIPPNIKQQLELVSYALPNARWMDPETHHLTLRFIGEVEEHLFREISEELTEVKAEPFELRVQGVGFSPPRGKPKTLWAGIAPCEALDLLQQRIARQLQRLKLPPEKKKFKPHITLAKIQHATEEKIAEYLSEHSLFRSETFAIEEFHLYSSQLSANGAAHWQEVTYPITNTLLPEAIRKMDLP